MKVIKLLLLAILVSILISCEKNIPVTIPIEGSSYVFVKSYCATITVGGFVGIREKCFNVGDTVICNEVSEGLITIRIAEHSDLNEGPPGPNTYQEYLKVPLGYLKLLKK